MPAPLLGIDFGTSNSAAAVLVDGEAIPVPLEDGRAVMPSAVFIGEDAFLTGRAAFAAYVAGEDGRFMRGLKSLLGSPLLHQATAAGGRRWRFADILARYVGTIKARAEEMVGEEITRAVMGRPVRFDDRSMEGDARAQDDLEAIVRGLGVRDVAFRFEPVAAAYDHARTLSRETLTLVADIGGGTSDFTLQYLSGRQERILATAGIHIGGSDYDREISLDHAMPVLGRGTTLEPGPMAKARLPMPNAPFIDLATWHRIPFLYGPRARAEHAGLLARATRPDLFRRYVDIVAEHRGHELAIAVEEAKIRAVDHQGGVGATARLDVCGHAEAGFDILALGRTTRALTASITDALDAMLSRAGIAEADIATLLWMGGSSLFSPLRNALEARLPRATPVSDDLLGSVSRGLVLQHGG